MPLRGLSAVQYQCKMKSYNSEKKLHEFHYRDYSTTTTTLSNTHISDGKNILSHLFLNQLLFSKLDFFFLLSLHLLSVALQHTTKKGEKKYIQARVKLQARHIC